MNLIPQTSSDRRFVLTLIALAVVVGFVATGQIKTTEFLFMLGGLLGVLLVANALENGLAGMGRTIGQSMRPPPMPPPVERGNTPYPEPTTGPDDVTPSGHLRR